CSPVIASTPPPPCRWGWPAGRSPPTRWWRRRSPWRTGSPRSPPRRCAARKGWSTCTFRTRSPGRCRPVSPPRWCRCAPRLIGIGYAPCGGGHDNARALCSRRPRGGGMTARAPSGDLDAFREQVRRWCRENIPADWRTTQTGASDAEFVRFHQDWFQRLRVAGYAVPHWPAAWGGGMPVDRQIVLYQELAAHDAPRLVLAFVGIHHAAATLLAAGTEAQRRVHLPAILDGEIWAQGFSEPGAGSDLAALRTAARRDGDHWVVTGQKVWVSGARFADRCLLLARTDPHAPPRRGISYFLLDMRSPGVEVRPIRQATGESHFCEVFLDRVRVPDGDLIGA